MENIIDPNFYSTIPVLFYAALGVSILGTAFISCYCYSCQNNRRISKMKNKELELERQQKEREKKKKEREKEFEGIILTKPAVYTEIV